jgi:hypothetical protein
VGDLSRIGTTKLSFNVRYNLGDALPTGTAALSHSKIGWSFAATSFDWFVISGTRVTFQGSGKLNGTGNYGFKVSAIDGGATAASDRFRMRVWDKNNGNALVFDNMPGAPEDAVPTTPLSSGYVTILP